MWLNIYYLGILVAIIWAAIEVTIDAIKKDVEWTLGDLIILLVFCSLSWIVTTIFIIQISIDYFKTFWKIVKKIWNYPVVKKKSDYEIRGY